MKVSGRQAASRKAHAARHRQAMRRRVPRHIRRTPRRATARRQRSPSRSRSTPGPLQRPRPRPRAPAGPRGGRRVIGMPARCSASGTPAQVTRITTSPARGTGIGRVQGAASQVPPARQSQRPWFRSWPLRLCDAPLGTYHRRAQRRVPRRMRSARAKRMMTLGVNLLWVVRYIAVAPHLRAARGAGLYLPSSLTIKANDRTKQIWAVHGAKENTPCFQDHSRCDSRSLVLFGSPALADGPAPAHVVPEVAPPVTSLWQASMARTSAMRRPR